jgi:hypothetical protein
LNQTASRHRQRKKSSLGASWGSAKFMRLILPLLFKTLSPALHPLAALLQMDEADLA